TTRTARNTMFDSLGRIPAPMRSQITTPPENNVKIMAIARRERNGSDAMLPFMSKPLSLHIGKFLSIRDIAAALPLTVPQEGAEGPSHGKFVDPAPEPALLV